MRAVKAKLLSSWSWVLGTRWKFAVNSMASVGFIFKAESNTQHVGFLSMVRLKHQKEPNTQQLVLRQGRSHSCPNPAALRLEDVDQHGEHRPDDQEQPRHQAREQKALAVLVFGVEDD